MTTRHPGTALAQDMAEQPDALAGLLARRGEIAQALAARRRAPLAGVLLVARGSSDNAATYGRYVLEAATGRPAALSANSLFTRYGCATDLAGWLVVGISQSGATPEIAEVVARTAVLGAFTVALTNDPASPLAEAADAVVSLGAGVERAVPATKTYTTTLLALALLAEVLGAAPWPAGTLEGIPDAVAALLEDRGGLDRAVAQLGSAGSSVHLGGGYLYCAALESALKMRETALSPVDGYADLDFLHGPIAAVDHRTAAVCHVGTGPTRSDALALIARLTEKGATVVGVGNGLSGLALAPLALPAFPESLAAIPHAIRGQQVAVGVALARGLDPDSPAGLTKVTRT